MRKTNFDKLVRWDADFYKSLTDDDCIVCLTEREVYLVGQIIDMLTWSNTRWIGDIVGLDFKAIAGNLENKLSERMTCQNITKLLQKITQLEQKVDYVFNETVVNEGDTVFNAYETVMDDVFTPEEMSSGDMAVEAEACDESGKSQMYGGVSQLVRYIVQANTDFLEEIGQNVGNIAEQTQTILGAFPPTDFLAADDLAKYVNFIVDELKEEYEAIVDEELIQATICDLFCIAIASDCRLTMYDVFHYFASKLSPSFSNVATTYGDLVQFALIGTFSSDMYFYFLCYFQLLSAAMSNVVTGDSLAAYEQQLAAGFNSPDGDWEIFCIECPTLYRKKIWYFDFSSDGAYITGGFDLTEGEYIGGEGFGLTPAGAEGDGLMTVGLTLEPSWVIREFAMKFKNKAAGDGNLTDVWIRTTAGSNVAGSGLSVAWGTSGWTYKTDFLLPITGWVEFALRYADQLADDVYLSHIGIIFDVNNAPDDAIITEDETFSLVDFP